MAWLTIFFIPVLPIRAYVVSPGEQGSVRLWYEMGLWSFVRLYRWRVFPYLATMLIESVARLLLVLAVLAVVVVVLSALFGRL